MKTADKFVRGGLVGVWLLAASSAPAAGFFVDVGDILTANYYGNKVVKVNPVTGTQETLGDFTTPTDVALSPQGDLYVAELGGVINRLTITNGVRSVVNPSTALNSAVGMVLSPDGNLYVTGDTNWVDVVMRINPATGEERIITHGDQLSVATGIEFVDAATLVVASFLNSKIVKVSLVDGSQTVLASGGTYIDHPWGLAVSGDRVYTGHYDSKQINRISASTGLITAFGTAPGFPYGMGLDLDGNLLVGAAGNTGQQDVLARFSPQGVLLRAFNVGLRQQISGIEVSPIRIGTLSTNDPPLAVADTIFRYPADGTKVSVATLLANDSDPDGDPIHLLTVSPTSANGGTVTWASDWVYYAPATGFTNVDSFTYTIADSGALQAAGTVSVQLTTDLGPSHALTLTNLGNGSFRLQFEGIPGRTYRIEYAENLPSPTWQTLGTNTASAVGLFEYVDSPPPGAPARYYRSAFP